MKVSILSSGGSKKLKKKKTSTQKSTHSPVYNEEIVFTNIKKEKLAEIQIQLALYHDSLTSREELGCVTVGCASKGNEYIQWKDMCDGKKSIAWWQTLRLASSGDQIIVDGESGGHTPTSCINGSSSSNHHQTTSSGTFKSRSSINAKLRKFLARSTSINR